MQVPINEIKVKNRIRKEQGDILSLAHSLKKYGQINPIVVTNTNVLVAGERRLEAAKSLRWKTIEAVVIESSDPLVILEYELEENNQRLGFTPEEHAAASRKVYFLKNPGFFWKIWNTIASFFKQFFRIKE